MYAAKVIILLFIFFCRAASYSRTDNHLSAPDSFTTNLAIFQHLADSLTVEMVQKSSVNLGTPIALSMKGDTNQWFVRQAIASTLRRMGYSTFNDSARGESNVSRLEVLPVLSVKYDNPSRRGLFGGKDVQRTINVSFTYQISDIQTGKVTASGDLTKIAMDMISEDSIPLVENDAIRSTKAPLPSDSIFDRIIEPLIIVGAAGTAIYLFFHVRS